MAFREECLTACRSAMAELVEELRRRELDLNGVTVNCPQCEAPITIASDAKLIEKMVDHQLSRHRGRFIARKSQL